ncbi:MAG: spermidine synthase, partial [Chloroflexi bacterium]|nr:spermidine synthase [Chloroflexota bacterium]
GLGILASRLKRFWFPPFPLMLFVLCLVVALNRLEIRIPSTQVLYYGAGEGIANTEHYFVLPIVFVLVTLTFIPLARPLGPLFASLPPLQAYAIDILGSLAGIAAFFVMSFLALPPLVWFTLLMLNVLPMMRRRAALIALPFFAGSLFIVFQLSAGSYWSPYYRITLDPVEHGYVLNVNNIGHQAMVPYLEKELFYFRAYDLFRLKPFKRVLVLGAGSGSDTSIALHNGAELVDAVEIDPLIYQLGARFNPDQPYADSRVHVFVDDGRAFLRNHEEPYDLIIFALPDSLTLTSGWSASRGARPNSGRAISRGR